MSEIISNIFSNVSAVQLRLLGEYSIVANAQTNGGTNADGERERDQSAVQSIQLDGNEYFNPNDPNVYRLDVIGTKGETDDVVNFEDFGEPFPGLRLPRRITFYTVCWSPPVPPVSNIGIQGRREVRLTAKSIEVNPVNVVK